MSVTAEKLNTPDNRPLSGFPATNQDGIRRDIENFDFPDIQHSEVPTLSFGSLDRDKSYNWRVEAHATNITATGFDLNIDPWSYTIMFMTADLPTQILPWGQDEG